MQGVCKKEDGFEREKKMDEDGHGGGDDGKSPMVMAMMAKMMMDARSRAASVIPKERK